MPKAAIDKYGNAPPEKDEVRRASQRKVSAPPFDTKFPEKSRKDDLGLFIAA
jgi:hypothetical protein